MKDYLFPLLFAISTIGSSAAAQSCNQESAQTLLEFGVSSGVIDGFSRFNGFSTLHFRQAQWDRMDYAERLGVFATLDCVIAGPGKFVSSIQAVNEGGRVLATWNGRTQRMQVN